MRSVAAALALLPVLALAAEPAKPPAAPAAPAEKAPPPAQSAAPALPPSHAAPSGAPAAGASRPAQTPPVDTNKALYAVGLAVGNTLEVFALTPAELDTVIRGIRDQAAGKPRFQFDQRMQAAVNELGRTRAPKAQEKAAKREKEQGPAYLAKMAKEKGARKTAGGAIVIPIREGSGPTPGAGDKVKVNYTGSLISGRVFDTSLHRGPLEFPLGQVIPCWTQALQTMKVGAQVKIVCPAELAYGPSGNGSVPGNAVLTFEVELLDIVK